MAKKPQEKISGVYEIVHRESGKRYIGSSINILSRWKEHIRNLNLKTHHCRKLQEAWVEYGQDAFDFRIIERCDKTQLISREQANMDIGYDYNTSPTARNCLGVKHSKETRRKQSILQRERFKKNPAYREHLLKISKLEKSDEWKRKRSQRLKGVPKKESQLVNMSKARALLSEDEVVKICSLRRSGLTIREISEKTGKGYGQIQRMCSGKSYLWVEGRITVEHAKSLHVTNAGPKNRGFNPTIFEFTHPVHGTRVCTQYDLKQEFPDLPPKGISAICTGQKTSCLGWRASPTS